VYLFSAFPSNNMLCTSLKVPLFAMDCQSLGFLLQCTKGNSFCSHFKTHLFLKLLKSSGSKFQVHFRLPTVWNQEMLYCHGFLNLACGYTWAGCSVRIASDHGLHGPGSHPGGDEIFCPSRPTLGPTQPPVQWVPGLSCGGAGRGADSPPYLVPKVLESYTSTHPKGLRGL